MSYIEVASSVDEVHHLLERCMSHRQGNGAGLRRLGNATTEKCTPAWFGDECPAHQEELAPQDGVTSASGAARAMSSGVQKSMR